MSYLTLLATFPISAPFFVMLFLYDNFTILVLYHRAGLWPAALHGYHVHHLQYLSLSMLDYIVFLSFLSCNVSGACDVTWFRVSSQSPPALLHLQRLRFPAAQFDPLHCCNTFNAHFLRFYLDCLYIFLIFVLHRFVYMSSVDTPADRSSRWGRLRSARQGQHQCASVWV